MVPPLVNQVLGGLNYARQLASAALAPPLNAPLDLSAECQEALGPTPSSLAPPLDHHFMI
eukprot:gene3263-3775_t